MVSLYVGNKETTNKNRLGVEGLLMLNQLLMKSKVLQFLDTQSMVIGDEEITNLCPGLKTNQTLIYLNISNNEFSSKSIEILSRALRQT